MANSAPWIWAASSLVRLNGALPGGTPTETGLRMRVRGLAFLAQEHGLRGTEEAGEEIAMVAGR